MSVSLINYLFLRKAVRIAQQYQPARVRIRTALMLYVGSPALQLLVITLFFTFGLPTVVGWIDQKAAGESIAMMLKVSVLVSGLEMLMLFPGTVYVMTDPAVRNSGWMIKFGIITVILWSLLTRCTYRPFSRCWLIKQWRWQVFRTGKPGVFRLIMPIYRPGISVMMNGTESGSRGKKSSA
ncbi:hypothetical protein [Pantoea vagans]|uniref:hypothetical protein n=1 Tax=Pantoea vagans TaxID=470934 RepID=UPI0028A66F53|nr:hypothetical protein [Pantoea vagans]